MTFYLEEIKWLFIYSFFSFFFSVLIVWINKEAFWIALLVFINWVDFPIIVTSLFEGIWTYLKLSVFLGLIISSLSTVSLFFSFFIPGLYENEYYRLKYVIIWIISMNIILFPILANFMGYWLLTEDLWLVAKMNQLLDNIINLFILLQILILIPILLQNNYISKLYINNRVYWILFFYLMISIVTPPDLFISISLLSIIIGIIEVTIIYSYLISKGAKHIEKGKRKP